MTARGNCYNPLYSPRYGLHDSVRTPFCNASRSSYGKRYRGNPMQLQSLTNHLFPALAAACVAGCTSKDTMNQDTTHTVETARVDTAKPMARANPQMQRFLGR